MNAQIESRTRNKLEHLKIKIQKNKEQRENIIQLSHNVKNEKAKEHVNYQLQKIEVINEKIQQDLDRVKKILIANFMNKINDHINQQNKKEYIHYIVYMNNNKTSYVKGCSCIEHNDNKNRPHFSDFFQIHTYTILNMEDIYKNIEKYEYALVEFDETVYTCDKDICTYKYFNVKELISKEKELLIDRPDIISKYTIHQLIL